MTFGERLKDARLHKGYTQKQLANIIGAKHNSISNWENDQNRPDPNTIELLCSVLDISANYLLGINKSDILTPEAEEVALSYMRANPKKQIIVRMTLDLHIKEIKDKFSSPEYLLPDAASEIEGASDEDKARDDAMIEEDFNTR